MLVSNALGFIRKAIKLKRSTFTIPDLQKKKGETKYGKCTLEYEKSLYVYPGKYTRLTYAQSRNGMGRKILKL